MWGPKSKRIRPDLHVESDNGSSDDEPPHARAAKPIQGRHHTKLHDRANTLHVDDEWDTSENEEGQSRSTLTEKEFCQMTVNKRRLQEQRQTEKRTAPAYRTSSGPIQKSRPSNVNVNPVTGARLDMDTSRYASAKAVASVAYQPPIHSHRHAIAMQADLSRFNGG